VSRGISLRTCVGCRAVNERGHLLRLVRQPDGTVQADPQGRLLGRGAYICWSEGCLDVALKRGRFAHAFRGVALLPPEGILWVRRLISSHEAADRL